MRKTIAIEFTDEWHCYFKSLQNDKMNGKIPKDGRQNDSYE